MLEATYLGWQGWRFATERSSILVDPLLLDDVGRGPATARASYMLWPPRLVNWSEMPPICGLFLSHEHEDHFDVRSLLLIDREVPVFISARSSCAAHQILSEMGFKRVTCLTSGKSVEIGDLVLNVFGPDHISTNNEDEWDVLAYAVTDRVRSNMFFTNVDIVITDAMRKALRSGCELGGGRFPVTQLCFSNLSLSSIECLLNRPDTITRSAEDAAQDKSRPAQVLEAVRGHTSIVPLPGETFVLENGNLVGVKGATAYVRCPPQVEWTARPRYWPAPGEPITPSVDDGTFNDCQLAELEAALAEVAEYLYGGAFFRMLYSLSDDSLEHRKPTFAWIFFTNSVEQCYAFEYRPSHCDFAQVDDPAGLSDRYVGIVACWASDFVALARGTIEPRNIVKGFRESWYPQSSVSFFESVVWKFYHPLRHPGRVLQQYQRILELENDSSRLIAFKRSV